MDKEQLKSRIDFNNIQKKSIETVKGIPETARNYDYLVDFEGNFIIPLTPLEVKLIEKIKELEARLKIQEEK
ncbi:hypothetical protein LCGC14_0371470 [marine sediment metagenome]|uniref:Uncharacterized protein n=1 Tax=marine sediment metagenome TaxID=412755 RepID=A0A0F9T541_9ZZZZ